MHILLTGSTGLLGASVLKALGSTHCVSVLVRALPENKQENVDYILCDLGRSIKIEKLPSSIDAVVHLAQSAHYRDFPDYATDVFQVNTASTVELLHYALQAGAKNFFLASTGSVYEPYAFPMTEKAIVNPTNFYPVSKFAAEKFMLAYQSHMNVCAFRLFFLYGMGKGSSLISTLITRVQKQQPIFLDGKTNGLKFTPTYVNDLAKLIDVVLEKNWSGVFNVAPVETITIRELALIIGEMADCNPQFEYTGKQEPNAIVPDLGRLREVYPEMLFTPLIKGLGELIGSAKVTV